MPLVRWLVSLLTVLTLLAQPLGAFASAGEKTDVNCCCPDPNQCKCHDEDGPGEQTIKRCAGAEHQVLPAIAVATIVAAPEPTDLPRIERAVDHRNIPLPDSVSREPEKPPF